MDTLINAAGRALAAGNPLGALQHVALRQDAPALALRGIAMAQLGELVRARELLRLAARRFGPAEARARARCVVAEAEVALALRELGGSTRPLTEAAALLQAQGDPGNAAQARLIAVRRLLLMGRLTDAGTALHSLPDAGLPSPALQAVAALARAEIALRQLHCDAAQAALQQARAAASQAGVPALQAEVDEAQALLLQPAARRHTADGGTALRLAEVQALLQSGLLVLDACRHTLACGPTVRPLARRPVLFALARALAQAWPGDVSREALILQVFRTRTPDDSHRARLRVQMGRLRRLVQPLAHVSATTGGYALVPARGQGLALLLPPIEGDEASLLALLADGAAWSTSALALALGESQRNVQRALAALQAAGRVRPLGRGRVQRWLCEPLTGITTILLLPAALPGA